MVAIVVPNDIDIICVVVDGLGYSWEVGERGVEFWEYPAKRLAAEQTQPRPPHRVASVTSGYPPCYGPALWKKIVNLRQSTGKFVSDLQS